MKDLFIGSKIKTHNKDTWCKPAVCRGHDTDWSSVIKVPLMFSDNEQISLLRAPAACTSVLRRHMNQLQSPCLRLACSRQFSSFHYSSDGNMQVESN